MRGFGSLDEESLEQAIRVLSGLTEGDRLVGIISHVAALKDRIDRQVVVHKERSGRQLGGDCDVTPPTKPIGFATSLVGEALAERFSLRTKGNSPNSMQRQRPHY